MGLGKVAPAPVIAAPVPDAAPVPLLEPPAPGAGARSPDEQASASTAIAVDQGDMGRNIGPPGWGPAPKVAADTRTRQHRGGSSRAHRPLGHYTRDAARYSLAIAFPFDLSDGNRVSTRLTTSFGSGAYLSSVAICWASGEIIHLRKSRMAFALAASGCSVCTSSQVKDEIGYASLPGALVIETRKSVFLSNLALEAAAVTEASVASTNSP